jgi:glycyl-tRNA synthetase beta chain
LGVIRLIVENRIPLPLPDIFGATLRSYIDQHLIRLDEISASSTSSSEAARDTLRRVVDTFYSQTLSSFIADRLKVALRERGVRHDLIDASFAIDPANDLVRLLARVQALQDFLATPDGANLLAAYKRAANILKIEEKRDGASYDGAPNATLLSLDEERALAEALANAGSTVDPLIAAEDFQGAMAIYAKLRPVVDAFFDGVTVNADQAEVRVNRLRLLSRIPGTLNKIADFSRIA